MYHLRVTIYQYNIPLYDLLGTNVFANLFRLPYLKEGLVVILAILLDPSVPASNAALHVSLTDKDSIQISMSYPRSLPETVQSHCSSLEPLAGTLYCCSCFWA